MGKAIMFNRCVVVSCILLAGMLITGPAVSWAADTVCARVKIEIKQELTLERQAFDAHMRINNGLAGISLENVSVDVSFADKDGNTVSASSDPKNTAALFYIRLDSMENIDISDGPGTVPESTSADIHWLIIPSPGSSNGLESGTLYYVGAKLTYTIGGEEKVTEVTPDYIFVKPMPEITLDYFLPLEVYGDDAFSSEIEPIVPFSLGVRVKNSGYGVARNLKIDSAQPKITENKQGLLIGFAIEGSEVNGQPATDSLLVDFGDISANSSAMARWIMTCTLSGKFVSFTADFSHSDELGGELTSLIKAVNTHFLVQDVIVDLPGRDAVRDFLARDGSVYRIYESEVTGLADPAAGDPEVYDQSQTAVLTGSGDTRTLQTAVTAGYMYVQLADPFGGQKVIKEVVRSDGKIIKPDNAWLSHTRVKDNPWQYHLNLFDVNSPGTYTLKFKDAAAAPLPPVLQHIQDQNGLEGQQTSFLLQASDPNGTIPELSATPLPVGAKLEDQGDGNGYFDWTPQIGQAGTYQINFSASDGKLADSHRVVITIHSIDDTDGDGLLDAWEMQHFGSLERDGSGDFDEDGILDMDEYLFGSNPAAEDFAPTLPEIILPVSGAEVALLQPQLVIENSIDENGDALRYEFEVFADPQLKIFVAGEQDVAQTDDSTSWTLPDNLNDNSRYDWRVRATDGYSFSQWAYGTFFVNTANNAPGPFAISFPKDDSEVDTRTPVLEVTNSADADPDDVAYIFEVYDDSTLSSRVVSSPPMRQGAAGTTAWTVSEALDDDTWYFWRVVAADEHDALVASELSSFLVNTTNAAPGAPGIDYPTLNSEVDVLELDLAVISNADGDTLSYYFELDKINTFDSPAKQVSDEIFEGVDTTTWHVAGLADNTRYFWRIKAGDGTAESRWTVAEFFVNRTNQAPLVPVLKNPGHASWVGTLKPLLQATPAADADGDDLSYHFEIYTDEALTDLMQQGSALLPEWTLASELVDKSRYYWRVRAEDEHGLAGEWMQAVSFFVKEMQADEITVRVSTSAGRALAGLKIYAFSESGTYTSLYATTDDNGAALFDPTQFADGRYRFRVDYMGQQFWSNVIELPGTYRVDVIIAEESTTLKVTTAAGAAENVKVYVFNDRGNYLGIIGTTDANGDVAFSLPSGFGYNFRADLMGNQHWSGAIPVEAGGANQFALNTGGGRYTVTVREDADTPMPDVRVYLFHANGSYRNRNEFTDSAGQVGFDVPAGTYKVRADYLGYQFWSGDTLIDADTDSVLDIAHQDVAVTVSGKFDQSLESLVSIPVYLFTAAGAYMNLNDATAVDGTVVLHLPQQPYKVRADYLGQQFWSEAFTWQDQALDIAMADAEVRVGWGQSYLEGVPVYVFNAANAYLNLTGTTAADGKVWFRLPSAGTYKFRADYQAGQFWSTDTNLAADQVNLLEITTGGGAFTLTVLKGENDPLVGALCYVFNESGAFFGEFGPTSSQGQVTFDLAQGDYNIRVDYLGYQFWSPLYDVPATLEDTFTILHQDVTVTVSGVYDATAEPLANIPVYLFTEAGAYMNLNPATDAAGQVVFSLPDQAYKARADYLDQQFWSLPFNQADTAVDIAMADGQISVTGGGQALVDVPVYAFTASGAYLNLTQNTDAAGQVSFRLPAGPYKFRANYQGSEYWTDEEVVLADQINPVEISTGGGPFVFTVLKDVDDPLVGVTCYVFSEAGAYLNMNAVTSSEGQVSFDLADGTYMFRVDYLGYQFWSSLYDVPTTLEDTFTILHRDVTVTVGGVYDATTQPLADIPVYLFTQAGAYMNLKPATDANGQVVFSLPAQAYEVRAEYRNQQFWSLDFNQSDTAVDIPMADALITVTGAGQPLSNVRVYVFTGGGTYLNMSAYTDANGQVNFRLPAGEFKFRADYQGSQYWKETATLPAHQVNPVEIDTGGGAFTLLVLKNDTDPLAGVRCYVFSESGAYLGLSGTTDAGGQIVFNLADGNYKYRVDHLGYQFWTDVYTIPDTLADTFTIWHQPITITVESLYQIEEPLENVRVYLFAPAGSYLNQNQYTGADGQVVFNLPDLPYKVRADYLGYQFWSEVLPSTDTFVTIDHGLARIHTQRTGVDLTGARVYLFTGAGAYLNWFADTDDWGEAEFLLPDRSYKFRADENGDQVWSTTIEIAAGQEHEVEVDLDQ